MLNILTYPTSAPISDELKVTVEDTDFKTSSATQGNVFFAFAPTSATQTTGDFLTILGNRFDVTGVNSHNTVDLTTTTTTLQAATNLKTAVDLNWNLSQLIAVSSVSAFGAGHRLYIVFKEGLIPNFTFTQSFTTNIGISSTNGTNTAFKAGGNVLMSVYDGTELINSQPIKAKPNSTEIATFYLRDLIKNRLDSGVIPFSCNDQPVELTGHKKTFTTKFTTVENSVTCGVTFGGVVNGNPFDVYNIMLDDSNEYGLVPYLFQNISQIGSKFVKWLTVRDKVSKISCNNCGYVNLIHSLPTTAQIKYETYANNSSTGVFTHPTLLSGAGTWAIPLNLNQSFIPSNTDKIDVWISNGVTDLSEKLTLAIDRHKNENELYFLNQFGTYDFLHFDSIQSIDIEVSGEETCSAINNNDSFNNRMQRNGKSIINIESNKTFTVTIAQNQEDSYLPRLIEELIKSPSVFMRFETETGVFKRKVNVLPNSYQIYQKDEKVFVELRLRTHNDSKIGNF